MRAHRGLPCMAKGTTLRNGLGIRQDKELARPHLKVVAEEEQQSLRQDGLGDLSVHALVPADHALLLVDMVQHGKGGVVGCVFRLEPRLAQDVGERDDRSEGLGQRTDDKRLARRHVAARGGEDHALDALVHTVCDRRVDREHQARLETAPEAGHAVLVVDIANMTEYRVVLLLSVAGRADLLARRNHTDRRREQLRKSSSHSAQHELRQYTQHGRGCGSAKHALDIYTAHERVPVEVGKLLDERIRHIGKKAAVQRANTLGARDQYERLQHPQLLFGLLTRRLVVRLDDRLDRIERVYHCIRKHTTQRARQRILKRRKGHLLLLLLRHGGNVQRNRPAAPNRGSPPP